MLQELTDQVFNSQYTAALPRDDSFALLFEGDHIAMDQAGKAAGRDTGQPGQLGLSILHWRNRLFSGGRAFAPWNALGRDAGGAL